LEEFTNNSVSFETLPKFESVPLQPLNRDYLNVVYIGNAVFAILLSIGTLIFLWVKEESQPLILPTVGATVLVIALLFWLSTISFRKKGYALREKDILFQKGILSRTTTVIPFSRIQHVALHEGFFSRMYQLSELQIYTAGGSSSDLHIPGLPKEQAEQMKTFLLQKITPIVETSTPDSLLKEEILGKQVIEAPTQEEETKLLNEKDGI
jgi:membrane protein YdbS with pleckstrin-like domain